jgi:hypothetical protein
MVVHINGQKGISQVTLFNEGGRLAKKKHKAPTTEAAAMAVNDCT